MCLMRWQINHQVTKKDRSARIQEIVDALFRHRGLTAPADIDAFLNPPHPADLSAAAVGLDPKQLKKAVLRINQAIKAKKPILIFGDYDADGITATAILWETLHALGAEALPFIPNRERHGYGLSLKGFDEASQKITGDIKPLVITVDNGITAVGPAEYIKSQGYDLIITDHHTPGEKLPPADCLVHTTHLCGAGVAWMLAKELAPPAIAATTLDLACIGTVADMMPVVGVNRSFVYHGLPLVQTTARPGLQALLKEANVDIGKPLTPYHIGYAIAPRLNAMGRLDDALDSLRLLCTKNPAKADGLAQKLGDTNRTRQDLTVSLLEHAKAAVGPHTDQRVIIIDHDTYHEGIIGLIAGKLAETYYRPAIVISRKKGLSKASARSIPGVNITNLIRSQSHLLAGVGGHPMAAGFSIETDQIDLFKQALTAHAEEAIDSKLLVPSITIDCQIDLDDISQELYEAIQQLQPFGLGNSQPLFAIENAPILSKQIMGSASQHLKLLLKRPQDLPLPALWFGHGDQAALLDGTVSQLAFTVDQNTWKGRTSLQVLIKSAKP
jgi:single-stranded-DNA-specific exonuclease